MEGSVNKKLAEELYKPVIKKFSRRRVYARFTDNIRAADLAQIESLSSKNKDIRCLLYVINHFTYVWVKPLKDKKNKTAFNAFMKIVNECNHKPKKLWVDQGEKFRNKLIQEWLDVNDILIHLTHDDNKSVIAERFIRTLKAKIYNKMTVNNSQFCLFK